jgi:hypothetical protein
LLRRLAVRNADLPPGAFAIDEAQLRAWARTFEPPESDELQPRDA